MAQKKSTFLKGYEPNFNTLRRAAFHQHLALVDCLERATGKHVAVVVAMGFADDGSVTMAPLARMLDGNPYEDLISPADPEYDRIDSTQQTEAAPEQAENRAKTPNSERN